MSGFKRDEIFFAEMYIYENAATDTDINVANQYHAISGLFSGDDNSNWSFVAGSVGSGTITTAAAGAAINIADVAHGLSTGDYVTVQSVNHSGTKVVTKVDADNFTVAIAYVGDEACFWQEGDYLLAGNNSSGFYRFSFSTSLISAGNLKTYKFEIVHNEDHIDESASERKIGTGADIGSMGSGGIHEITAGDRVFLTVKNIGDTTNLTLVHANISFSRI
jgi:hypothetical protein